ncbi:MAG: PilT/PilU family type 4a pilus ATPase [Proteobacteria bacterium]|nr:PilT/PilU family type 4a pilus ATPase [Pseudomonadota bacterium]MBU1594986.1 PilT/PilU family type 4a pilus ATPase [Pseudomonadota bacterium]
MTRAQLDGLLTQVLDLHPEVADVILTTGKPIQAEVHGSLKDAVTSPDLGRLSPLVTKAMALALIGENARLQKTLAARGSCDLSYAIPGRGRFRVNIFSQRGSLALVLRRLPSAIPTMAELGLPEAFEEMAKEKQGLILVTGGTGSGKSHSLAALIDRINSTSAGHIVTLEDPVEFTHPHKLGTVNQRELGIDFDTFASGLRAAFRQGPKVILLGEVRDPESMEIALQAAGTGHLVLSTLHTADAGSTIGRILGLFSPGEERLIRMRLAESLRFVVSQRLLPRAGGGRVAAFEVLKNTLRVKELIQQGETGDKTFYSVLEAGSSFGMQTFDQHVLALFQAGAVSEETALLSASDRARLGLMLDRAKSLRGQKVTSLVIEGLVGEDPFAK